MERRRLFRSAYFGGTLNKRHISLSSNSSSPKRLLPSAKLNNTQPKVYPELGETIDPFHITVLTRLGPDLDLTFSKLFLDLDQTWNRLGPDLD